jgi:multiple sugar transport system permease protein
MDFFKSIPRELEDAAMVDGLTRFGAFLRLMIPHLHLRHSHSRNLYLHLDDPGICLGPYLYLFGIKSDDRHCHPHLSVRGDVYYWGALMAACLIASLPVAFLYNLFLGRFIAAFTVGAVK